LKSLEPPPFQYIENFQSHPFNARKYFGAPLTSSPPPPPPLGIINVLSLTDKEIREIKINSVSKNTKACVKILRQLFASGLVIIKEYLP
jgi:hypothetical protein